MLRLQLYPPCLQMSSLKLDIELICTGLFAGPHLLIFKLLGVGNKIFT